MPNPLNLDRQILARFLPNHQSILAFEQMQNSVSAGLPSTIEEAAALAALATAIAQQALGMLGDAMAELERLQTAPRSELGTISPQNADAVDITGGRIGLDAGTVAAPSFYLGGDVATGFYRISLNRWGYAFNGVKLLDLSDKLATLTGRLAADNAGIGTAALPSLYLAADSATGFYSLGPNNWGFAVAGVKLVDYSFTTVSIIGSLTATGQLQSTIATGAPPLVVNSTTLVPNLYVAQAALADTATVLTSPSTFPAAATDLPTVITLANALRAAAIAKGL